MAYRNIKDVNQSPENTELQDSLLEGDLFVYAHLVKFEKPLNESGKIPSRKAENYTYITDASYDISFDDNSSNASGVGNGTQKYRANTLLSVSNVTETIEARASNFNIKLAATAISTKIEGASLSINDTAKTLEITSGEDFVGAGFIEGHEVRFNRTIGGSWNSTAIIRLDTFTNDNKTANYTLIKGNIAPAVETVSNTDVVYDTQSVTGLLLDKGESNYARYINREVFIYKAHINPETGDILSAPFLLFKGIINSGKMTEDPSKGTTVNWSVTSHWGDFININGRITSDTEHRAVSASGAPQYAALLRSEYGNDLGFMHSEQAINLIAIYQAKETKYKLKKKSSWLGLKKSYKMVEYEVDVDRQADLRFNLQAKYLPVIYGVQKVDSIPVFVDTDKNNSAEIYVAYAICEGEIHSIYDIYFDDQNSICLNEQDNDTRSTQNSDNTVPVLCTGRMDRGDVLKPQDTFDPTTTLYAADIVEQAILRHSTGHIFQYILGLILKLQTKYKSQQLEYSTKKEETLMTQLMLVLLFIQENLIKKQITL